MTYKNEGIRPVGASGKASYLKTLRWFRVLAPLHRRLLGRMLQLGARRLENEKMLLEWMELDWEPSDLSLYHWIAIMASLEVRSWDSKERLPEETCYAFKCRTLESWGLPPFFVNILLETAGPWPWHYVTRGILRPKAAPSFSVDHGATCPKCGAGTYKE